MNLYNWSAALCIWALCSTTAIPVALAEETVHGGAWLFSPPKREVPRSNGLQIIGAGFPRTGTFSLHLALNILGFECYHMSKVNTAQESDLWVSFLDKKISLEHVVEKAYLEKGYTAGVDAPTANIWRELAELYPEAKIILTERISPEVWFESTYASNLIPTYLTAYVLFVFTPFGRSFGLLVRKVWPELLKLKPLDRWVTLEDRDASIETYKQNSLDAVAFGKEHGRDVLVFQVSQGWEPLCKFLNKPIPDVPFPRTNSREGFQRTVLFQGLAVLTGAVVIAVLAIVLLRQLIKILLKNGESSEKKQK